MNLLKEHMDILKRLTTIASKETQFNERGQFMNIQKMVDNQIRVIERLKEFDVNVEEEVNDEVFDIVKYKEELLKTMKTIENKKIKTVRFNTTDNASIQQLGMTCLEIRKEMGDNEILIPFPTEEFLENSDYTTLKGLFKCILKVINKESDEPKQDGKFITRKMIEDCTHPIDVSKENTIKVVSMSQYFDAKSMVYLCDGLFDKVSKRLQVNSIRSIEEKDIKDLEYDLFIIDARYGGTIVKDRLIKNVLDENKIIEHRPTTELQSNKHLKLRNDLTKHNIVFENFDKSELLEVIDSLETNIKDGFIKLTEGRSVNRLVFDALEDLNYYCDVKLK